MGVNIEDTWFTDEMSHFIRCHAGIIGQSKHRRRSIQRSKQVIGTSYHCTPSMRREGFPFLVLFLTTDSLNGLIPPLPEGNILIRVVQPLLDVAIQRMHVLVESTFRPFVECFQIVFMLEKAALFRISWSKIDKT